MNSVKGKLSKLCDHLLLKLRFVFRMTERGERMRRREEGEELSRMEERRGRKEREELNRLEELARTITDSEDEKKEEGESDESVQENCKALFRIKEMENVDKEDCLREEIESSSGSAEYCVVCQAGHAMAPSCFTCRACGAPGHLARDCAANKVIVVEEDEMIGDVVEEKGPEQRRNRSAGPRGKIPGRRERMMEDKDYALVYCHLELLRSSTSPTLHLTQLAATSPSSTFFRPILPPVLAHYLDHYQIGGELLKALNMVREEATTFLFRPPVLVEQVERVECVREDTA